MTHERLAIQLVTGRELGGRQPTSTSFAMSDATHYVGQRLSLHSQPGTVRYLGKVANKAGEWLGIEWDDARRGKNDGSHDGVRYFECRSRSLTAASFLRPSQSWDKVRTFLQALTDKYFQIEEARSGQTIFVSRTKHIEQIGFEEFALRQAKLKGIYVLVLDHMQIGPLVPAEDHDNIKRICANITDLSVGGNLFEQLGDILKLCSLLPKLKRLTLDGNRIAVPKDIPEIVLEGLRIISLAGTSLNEDELTTCLTSFPNVEELIFADNALTTWHSGALPQSLRSVNLSHNDIGRLDQVASILALPALHSLNLKDNVISHIAEDESHGCNPLSSMLQELDLGRNQINDWQFFNHLLETLPALRSLRVSGNPLYLTLESAEHKALAAEDGYMLTVARLPTIDMLNYSVVREKDRLNAEKYYLNQIAIELSKSSITDRSSVLTHHPRWASLCQEYGIPEIRHDRSGELNPHSLMARLVSIRFRLYDSIPILEWSIEVPRAFNIYALYGLVGKRLNIMPVNFRLIWESGERDPISHKHDYHGPEWWDSSDDEAGSLHETWTMRNVKLEPGTRAIGTYLEGRHADVRVEMQ